MITVHPVDAERADDDAFVRVLTHLVNRAYALAEANLWTREIPRTAVDEMRGWIESMEVVAAHLDGRPVGAVRTRTLRAGNADTADTAWFGALSVEPSMAGRGIASQLVDHVERHAAAHGRTSMQIEVLSAPSGHAHLERLSSWYQLRGYRESERRSLAEFAPDDAELATTPLEVVVMTKSLSR